MATRGSENSMQGNERKLTKSERKVFKKQARKLHSLKNKEGNLTLSENPTNHLFIGNGGLICGMDRNSLLQLFGKYGDIQSLYLLPGKEFAVLSYKTKHEAMDAHKNLNGCPLVFPDQESKRSITFYLAYLTESFSKSELLKWDIRPVMPWQRHLHPPGLVVVEDFISKDVETKLIEHFTLESSHGEIACDKMMKHRKVKHYGYEFIYGKNGIDKDNPLDEYIPGICNSLINKMVSENLIPWQPDQLTVNQYDAGQGIPPHIDTHSAFEDGIISLSLASQVVMEFRHPDGKELSLILPPRSLLIMKGESRYLWTHGITPRKTDIVIDDTNNTHETCSDKSDSLTLKERGFRMSLTFRKILKGECKCKYPEKCDSQGFARPSKEELKKDSVFVPRCKSEAQELEALHVYKVYDEIADHFSDTRHSPWPKVSDFLRSLPSDSFVADVGCGNGKYLGVNKSIKMFGSDRSVNLIKICRERGHCAIVSDALALPYRSNAFDACISIAVIHHLSTEERRELAIRQLLRIVKPNGFVLVYVWAQEQSKDVPNSGNLAKVASDKCRCTEEGKLEKQLNEVSLDVRSSFSENPTQENPAQVNPAQENPAQKNPAQENQSNREAIIKTISGDNMKMPLETYQRNTTKDDIKKVCCPEETDTCGESTRDELTARTDYRKKIEINDARNVFQQQDLLIPWHFRGKQEKRNKTSSNDTPTEAKTSHGEQVYHRFYHVFVEGELERLCTDIGGCTVVKSYNDKGNWCIILKKL